jgi:hypothetical protein
MVFDVSILFVIPTSQGLEGSLWKYSFAEFVLTTKEKPSEVL